MQHLRNVVLGQFLVPKSSQYLLPDYRLLPSQSKRLRRVPTLGATLYCTTFPCHICAKHIVAAGLDKVVFLEPYPKSYAKELHSDSIEIEGREDISKVKFVPFVGISPVRYRDFFEKGKRKDGDGKAVRWKDGISVPSVEIYHPVYITLENIVASKLKQDLEKAAQKRASASPSASAAGASA